MNLYNDVAAFSTMYNLILSTLTKSNISIRYAIGAHIAANIKRNTVAILIRINAAYMRQWIGSTLVQIMALRLVGAKPLFKTMQGYCQLDPCKQTSVTFWSKYKTSYKCIWRCRCAMAAIFPGGDELTDKATVQHCNGSNRLCNIQCASLWQQRLRISDTRCRLASFREPLYSNG